MLIRNLLTEPWCVLMHRHTQFTALTCTSAVNEVVVARQLKHAACRTARVERRHRWLLSHTQAPPVALEQTEAARGIAVARTIRCLGAVGGGSGVPSARGGIFRTCTSRAMPPVDSSSYASRSEQR